VSPPQRLAGTSPAGAGYVGRFAPSPNGPLHEGSLLAALASWQDARAHQGRWLVRMEDVDTTRCNRATGEWQLRQLAEFGLASDAPVVWQSERGVLYQAALDKLVAAGHAYPCGCSRSEVAAAQAPGHQGEPVYPGTCRPAVGGSGSSLHGKPLRAWRLRVPVPEGAWVEWEDRRLGPQRQNLATEHGDFVLWSGSGQNSQGGGQWAYQLAVVVDDAAQGVTHVVRGDDLLASTARQIYLQQLLGLPTPSYLHIATLKAESGAHTGQKLSKQNGAQAVVYSSATAATLREAASMALAGLR
jgi:glutamyl-Q tRNA(Asp) synthetase